MIWTPETVRRAGPLGTMHRILVTIVTAVVVTVAQPVWFHAYVRFLALQMVGRTRYILRTPVVGFIRSRVIFAVVNTIAYLKI